MIYLYCAGVRLLASGWLERCQKDRTTQDNCRKMNWVNLFFSWVPISCFVKPWRKGLSHHFPGHSECKLEPAGLLLQNPWGDKTMYSCSASRIDFLFLWSLVCFHPDQRLLVKCFGLRIEFKIHQGQEQTLIKNHLDPLELGTTIWVKESGYIPASPKRHKDVVPKYQALG